MKKILVVDDDKSIRLVLSTALTRSGFLVKTSATTAGFWSLLNDDDFAWNFGLASASAKEYKEAEEMLLQI